MPVLTKLDADFSAECAGGRMKPYISRRTLIGEAVTAVTKASNLAGGWEQSTTRGVPKKHSRMKNDIALTQRLFNGKDEHDLAKEIAAWIMLFNSPKRISQIHLPSASQSSFLFPLTASLTFN